MTRLSASHFELRVFVDDMAVNIEGSESVGMPGL